MSLKLKTPLVISPPLSELLIECSRYFQIRQLSRLLRRLKNGFNQWKIDRVRGHKSENEITGTLKIFLQMWEWTPNKSSQLCQSSKKWLIYRIHSQKLHRILWWTKGKLERLCHLCSLNYHYKALNSKEKLQWIKHKPLMLPPNLNQFQSRIKVWIFWSQERHKKMGKNHKRISKHRKI